MAGRFGPTVDTGSNIPTTVSLDVAPIYNTEVGTPEFKELIVKIAQAVNVIDLAVNQREAGSYYNQSFTNGQTFFPNPALDNTTSLQPQPRGVQRMVVNFGALPNAGTTSVNHNIPVTTTYSFTRIYGVASDMTNRQFLALPYASPTLNKCIEVFVNATQVSITTGIDRSAFTTTYVVLEYITN